MEKTTRTGLQAPENAPLILCSAEGGIRSKYSAGNFKGVRKGTICQDGQICGGTGNSYFIRNQDNKRIGRANLEWLSHKFKTHEVNGAIPPTIEIVGILAPAL